MHWAWIVLIVLVSLVVFLVVLDVISKYATPHPESRMKERRGNDQNSGTYTTAHFVYGLWDDTPIPQTFQSNMEAWGKQGWKIKLWNKSMVDKLLDKYPEYKELIPSFSRKVQIADLARLLILYDEGGHYFDLDCVPTNENLYEHLNTFEPDNIFYSDRVMGYVLSTILGIMKPIRKFKAEHNSRIANFAFGGKVGDPIVKRNLELLKERCLKYASYTSDYDVIYKTGPDCTTTAVHEFPTKTVLEYKHWMNHMGVGTWRQKSDQRSLKSEHNRNK